MDAELKAARITGGAHAVLAIIIGWLSPMVGSQFGTNWAAGGLGILLLIVCGYVCEKFAGKKGIKFWVANGVFIYLLLWLVSWTYFVNI